MILARSPDETGAFARRVAMALRAGDVVLLIGDLGAGKTTFTKALAQALGVVEPVTSPTFTLVRTYATATDLVLVHIDAYRLEGPEGLDDLALPELLEDGGCAVIEWGDLVARNVGPDHLDIRFEAVDDDDEARFLSVTGHGSWSSRAARLASGDELTAFGSARSKTVSANPSDAPFEAAADRSGATR